MSQKKLTSIFAMWLLLTCHAAAVQHTAGQPLTNRDVIEMVKAGFDEETVIKAIEANEASFDLSVQALMALKNAGVSQKILGSMLTARKAKGETSVVPAEAGPSAPSPGGLPEDVGVYVKRDGKLEEVEPEIVTWRTGGFLKSVATMGLTKGHVNGVVKGPKSRLQTSVPLEFVIRCPEGTSAAEYQLLRMDGKPDRREFRALTGGVIHASGGADKNAVAFEPQKLSPRTFSLRLRELKAGEYGLLPPGAFTSASATSVGKLYTFGIE